MHSSVGLKLCKLWNVSRDRKNFLQVTWFEFPHSSCVASHVTDKDTSQLSCFVNMKGSLGKKTLTKNLKVTLKGQQSTGPKSPLIWTSNFENKKKKTKNCA